MIDNIRSLIRVYRYKINPAWAAESGVCKAMLLLMLTLAPFCALVDLGYGVFVFAYVLEALRSGFYKYRYENFMESLQQ